MTMHKLPEYRELMKKHALPEPGPVADEIYGRKTAYLDKVKVVEEKDGILICDFVISNGNIDRDFDTINPDGWSLENYRKNPVVLWDHEWDDPPVAKSLEERIENGQLIGRAQFVSREIYDFGYMIGQMYKNGFLNAVSCGFRATEWKYVEDESRPWGIDFLSQELWEYSCCTIPSNPDATLVKAKAAGIDVSAALKLAEKALDDSGVIPLLPKETAEKIYSLLRADKAVVDMKTDDLLKMQMQLQINENMEV